MDELNQDIPLDDSFEANYDASLDEQMEERSHTEVVRDSGKSVTVNGESRNPIKSYKFRILIRDKQPLEGELSRDEMNLIYNLYSNEGANLTQRATSRYFPHYTFRDFKKILRAFSITKDCVPFAPHIKEEHTYEQMEELYYQNKDNNFLKKLEQNRYRKLEQDFNALRGQHKELKDSVSNFSAFLGDLKIETKIHKVTPTFHNNNTIVLYLSDMHIGADVSSFSIYQNKFNYEASKERIIKILDRVVSDAGLFNVTNIVVCNLGDSLDGMDGQTTRRGHNLPQNMNNKEQFNTFVKLIIELFDGLVASGRFDSYKYISVEGGNHDGDAGYMANKVLENLLPYRIPNLEARVFDKFIEHFTVGNNTFLLCHGKDAKDMFKGLPLVLNDKVENQISEFIDYNKLTGKIHFVKGDLHQSATTYAKKFRYKSVGSFFGSSEWIHKNFGNTYACLDYDIISSNQIFEGRLILQ